MNVDFYMAVRARYVYDGQRSLAAAMLARDDSDDLAQAIDAAYEAWCGDSTGQWVDVIESKIAELVDGGAELPVSNPETMELAQWFAEGGDLAALPDPMPRLVVLYLAKALADNGKYDSMVDALQAILAAKTFF